MPYDVKDVQGLRPVWSPLIRIVGYELAEWFMWMCEIELANGDQLHAYKHHVTRRYLHLTVDERCFAMSADGRYAVVPLLGAMTEVFETWWDAPDDLLVLCARAIDRARTSPARLGHAPRRLEGAERAGHDGGMSILAEALARTSLGDPERRTLARLVPALEEELGGDLRSVWLYGSRARGEAGHPDSDVDVLVVTRQGRRDFDRVQHIAWTVALAEGFPPEYLSVHLRDPEMVAHKRAIDDFFMQEVDRDKIVLAGEP